MVRSLMFQGTGSDVGKTIIVAGLCRAAYHRGIKVYPFKPQNMSNNSAVAVECGEIGRGQWLQALAAHVEPSVHMNPVLLKPQSATGSQIIVQGQVFGKASGQDYFSFKKTLLKPVLESYAKLQEKAELILIEGAGSPAEINLRAGDIANMGFAQKANVPVVLIGDIDRGGVIASIVGTHTILDRKDKALIEGYIINKFRGDPSLFDDGFKAIAHFTKWRSFGMIPWLQDARLLPAEDSFALNKQQNESLQKTIIAVPVTSHIANFDDLDPLRHEDNIDVRFIHKGENIPQDAALIILPGSKSTIKAMEELCDNGWAKQIQTHAESGKPVIGICGGYQMLGNMIYDPDSIEGTQKQIKGLSLLRVETIIKPHKIVSKKEAKSLLYHTPLQGYEIHMGETTGEDCQNPPVVIDGVFDGAISQNGNVWGTYLHGLFENDLFRKELLKNLNVISSNANYLQNVHDALDNIAAQLEASLDIDALFALAR